MMSFYPIRLIPTVHSIKLTRIDHNSILCRWTSEELKDFDGKLNAAAVFPSKDGQWKLLKDYSLNMIPPSDVSDILIKISDTSDGGYEDEWIEGTQGLYPGKDEYDIDINRKYFLFSARTVDGFKSTFPFPFDPNLSKDKWCSFELSIEHKPLKANYSHCQFRFKYFDIKGKEIDSVSDNTFKKVIAADVRQYLIEHSKFSVADFEQ